MKPLMFFSRIFGMTVFFFFLFSFEILRGEIGARLTKIDPLVHALHLTVVLCRAVVTYERSSGLTHHIVLCSSVLKQSTELEGLGSITCGGRTRP